MLSEQDVCALLHTGTIEELGRIPEASNDTRLVTVTGAGHTLRAVYKPVAGERPLRDFPLHSLAGREVACYRLSAHCSLARVPPTVMREDLDAGPGSLQVYVESTGEPDALVTVFDPAEVPAQWAAILEAVTEDGDDVVVAHSRTAALREQAIFDALTNNADRKASHLLFGHYLPDAPEPAVFGIDNGLTFHPLPKLRTVLWGFAGSPLAAAEGSRLAGILADEDVISRDLASLLGEVEVEGLFHRVQVMLDRGRLPGVPSTRTPIPWPPL